MISFDSKMCNLPPHPPKKKKLKCKIRQQIKIHIAAKERYLMNTFDYRWETLCSLNVTEKCTLGFIPQLDVTLHGNVGKGSLVFN